MDELGTWINSDQYRRWSMKTLQGVNILSWKCFAWFRYAEQAAPAFPFPFHSALVTRLSCLDGNLNLNIFLHYPRF